MCLFYIHKYKLSESSWSPIPPSSCFQGTSSPAQTQKDSGDQIRQELNVSGITLMNVRVSISFINLP